MNVELKSMPFDSNEVYDPASGATSYDRVAYSKDLADWLATYFSNGIVIKGSNILTTELQVTHTGGLNLSVNRGVVVINGRTGWVQEPTELTVDMGGANPRIDRVVMELNIADRFIYLKVLKGTENANPVAPELSQTDDLYHIPLAQVRVEAASAVVGTVTDERAGYLSNVTVGIKPPTGNDAVTVRVSDEVKTKLGLSDESANVDKALQTTENIGMASYLAFCTNANTDSLDSAFGKNNEENISGLGKALAMYGWFKGDSKTDYPYANLKKCNTVSEILRNAFGEVGSSDNLTSFIKLSPYFVSQMGTIATTKEEWDTLFAHWGMTSLDYTVENIASNTDWLLNPLKCWAILKANYMIYPTTYNNLDAYISTLTSVDALNLLFFERSASLGNIQFKDKARADINFVLIEDGYEYGGRCTVYDKQGNRLLDCGSSSTKYPFNHLVLGNIYGATLYSDMGCIYGYFYTPY